MLSFVSDSNECKILLGNQNYDHFCPKNETYDVMIV